MMVAVLLLQTALSPLLVRGYGLFWQVTGLSIVIVVSGAIFVIAAMLLRHPDLRSLLRIAARTRYGSILKRWGISVTEQTGKES
jgi:hypothetical protein